MPAPPPKTLCLYLVAVLGCAYLGQHLVPWRALLADERSGPDQVRQVTLSDASQLWLNHNTRVNVDFTAQQRRLVLIQGEVMLDSSNDPRPLVIETPSGEVRATAGRVSVDYQRDGSYVNAFAGDVHVHPRLGQAALLPSGKGVWLRRAGSSWQWDVRPSRLNSQGWPTRCATCLK